MKFLIVFAVLFLVQTMAAQEIQQDHKKDQHEQGHVGLQDHKQNVQNNQNNVADNNKGITNYKPQQNVVHNTQAQQHVANEQHPIQKPTKSSHTTNPSPSQIQSIISPVSQQKPEDSQQHVASNNKQRKVRSLVNRRVSQQPYKVEEIPGKCNYICDQVHLTVCGFNGQCHREFESQCELNIYNCINTHKIFHIVDDISCIDSTTVKCYQGDM